MSTPFVSGFTFIKNALKLGYPIKESLESIEPLCDEVIINVGFDDQDLKRDDGTYNYLRDHFPHPKFRFYKSFWDPSKTHQGEILAEQTNIALSYCEGKICQYIQGDEILHEKDYSTIHDAYIKFDKRVDVDGLLFNYVHFYGNVDIIKHTRSIYRKEIRAIRNKKNIRSWKDAQGFRYQGNTKISCQKVDASIYHYGWARKELVMKDKVMAMDKLYHAHKNEQTPFKYERIWGLKPFTGLHPEVMKKWIKEHRNEIDIMSLPLKSELKNVGLLFSDVVENFTGFRIGEYQNYYLVD